MTDDGIIYSAYPYKSNAELIEACAKLGYLRREWRTLDPTFGNGTFWKAWRPVVLIGTDLSLGIDFQKLPWDDDGFDVVVFDPPYKLNGTPTAGVDSRYGVGKASSWQDRISLMQRGQKECARVLKKGGYLLTKCQDQVVSGRKVWQTDIMTAQAAHDGLTKVDRLDMLTTPRPQPHSRQVHSRTNYSTMLVFRK